MTGLAKGLIDVLFVFGIGFIIVCAIGAYTFFCGFDIRDGVADDEWNGGEKINNSNTED